MKNKNNRKNNKGEYGAYAPYYNDSFGCPNPGTTMTHPYTI